MHDVREILRFVFQGSSAQTPGARARYSADGGCYLSWIFEHCDIVADDKIEIGFADYVDVVQNYLRRGYYRAWKALPHAFSLCGRSFNRSHNETRPMKCFLLLLPDNGAGADDKS